MTSGFTRLSLIFLLGVTGMTQTFGRSQDLDFNAEDASRFAHLALGCVHLEYPNKISHVMSGDSDLKPPRELTPVFYGCFDWHSSVHGHWLLVRLCRLFPDEPFSKEASDALAKSFTADNVVGEVTYLEGKGRASFERPYGIAWFLQLMSELHGWDDPRGKAWSKTLAPIESILVQRLKDWFPKLLYPIRTGEHSQTAFAMGLIHDYAVECEDAELEMLIGDRAIIYYGNDQGAPLHFEPSGQDFLSPVLAEADLMRRVMPSDDYAKWLQLFLPQWESQESITLPIGKVSDRSDGKLAHIDGLNLSRAWMIEGIASALSEDDPRRGALDRIALEHTRAGLDSVTGEHYEGGHWLGSFAVYLTSRRGIQNP